MRHLIIEYTVSKIWFWLLVAGRLVVDTIDCDINQQPANRLVEPAAGRCMAGCLSMINFHSLSIIKLTLSLRFKHGILREIF